MFQRNLYLITLLCSLSFTAFGQDAKEIANKYLLETAEEYELSAQDLADWVVTDEHISRTSGVHHIYMRQRYQGIEIIGAEASVHILATGRLLQMHNQFFPDLESIISGSTAPGLTAPQAIEAASRELNYSFTQSLELLKSERNTAQEALYSKGDISVEDIPIKLVYQLNDKGELRLSWDMSIAEPNGLNWWSLRVDATTGEILDRNNWIVNCDFDHGTAEHDHVHSAACTSTEAHPKKNSSAMMMGDQYNVFDAPVESPIHGSRSIVVDPAHSVASPFGWHDTNGQTGAEFTTTVGNNVWAQEDRNGNNGFGYSPDGGAALSFDFPLDLTQAPAVNQDPNITNLFYWNNIIHDVLYVYGFDEVAGNFQETNYGRGGLGSDHVWGDAQDGSGTNNANFGTPPDGSNPRMQMFLWTAPNPDRDGDLDNGIIVHEYGHGISNRLTGGPSNSNCLGNREQMGEGWSDWYGLMFTIKASDTGADARGIGTYALNQPTSGNGIRTFPYSTDLAVNPDTYDRIKTTGSVHRTGSIWCAMIWELTWALIDQYGFDPDFYHGTGGNNIAMQLVTEAMKLQPCRPGFVDGRDAILAADVALYDGANRCEIWNAFAKRGLGFSATQGSSNSRTDGNEAFDLPGDVATPCSTSPDFMVGLNPIRQSMCPGDMPEFRLAVYEANGYTGTVTLSATGLPAGVTATITPSTITTFPTTATLVLNNTAGVPDGNYTIEITGTDNTITHKGFAVIDVQSDILGPPTLDSPADGAVEVSRLQNFSWSGVTGAVGYDLEIATDAGFANIVQSGTGIDAEIWTSAALSSNTTYYWRMRTNSFCGGGSYSAARTFTIQSCGNTFVDSGGASGEYDDGELFTYVLCPDNAGEFIQLDFTVFDIEPNGANACYDHLEVFDGDNLSAPSLGQFCGTGIANAPGGGTIIGENATGCLTFQFFSDAFVTDPGWEATISCLECIAPTISSSSATDATCVWSNDGSLTASSGSGNPVEFVLTPSTGGKLISTTGTFNNLVPGTYTLQVREVAFPDCISAVTNVVIGSNNSTVDIIYVNKGATGNNDGSSWLDAYVNLQDALDDANTCSQVWVASELYTPTAENPHTTATGSRDQAFAIDNRVGVFGGFAGGETDRDNRDPSKNTTILSGDIGTQGNASDNSWHVIWIQQANATLDGFVISDGAADDGATPNFRGGGLYNNGGGSVSNPVIMGCTFRNNKANDGGAVYNNGSTAGSDASPSFINTVFTGNNADNNGGAMYNNGTNGQSTPKIMNCSFAGNFARTLGGALYNETSDVVVENSILYGNTGGSMENSNSSPVVNFSLLEEGTCPTGATCDGASTALLGQDPLFSDADGPDNTAGTADDRLQLSAGSPALEAGTFVDAPALDLEGNPRPQGRAIDLGPYELNAVLADLRVFLQGGYVAADGEMRTDLAAGAMLPTTEPFTAMGLPHNNGGGGESSTQAIFIANDITDWIFVEIRDQNDQNVVLATRSALLKSNGQIVDMDGKSPLAFFDKLPDDYFVAIRHQNHLGVLSSVVVSLAETATTYDFTGSADRAVGGALALIDLGGNVFAMPSGDFDHNGQVQNTDYNSILLQLGQAGYLPGDIDLNGQVQNSEVQTLLVPNTGRGVQYNY